MERKAVFFDIDGTLWDKNRIIPESTIAAIKSLRANGHYALINSGRTRGHITDEKLLSIGWDGIVSGCGTCIEIGDETRLYHRIDNAEVAEAIREFRAIGCKIILEGRYHLYFDHFEFDDDPYGIKLAASLGEHRRTILDFVGKWECSKYSIDTKALDDLSPVKNCLPDKYNLIVHSMNFSEVVPTGFDKATGMREALEALNISSQNCIAIGDATNDLGMLNAAGTAVVMGNGNDEAKAAADYITTSIYEDGIKTALVHLGLI